MTKRGAQSLILAGDIGGTTTRLGLFQQAGSDIRLQSYQAYQSNEYSNLKSIVAEFMQDGGKISAACFGVAGPVVGGMAVTTNLSWKISESSLAGILKTRNVALVNDLVANAYGIGVMTGKDFAVLNRGKQAKGNRAILSAGTGLGAAILFWDGRRHVPSPSEGGHVEFGPKNSLELALLQYLFDRFGHVSYERVLSGAGLFNIYQFLRDQGKYGTEPGWLASRMAREDPAALIAETACRGGSRLCSSALDLFASIYGAAAGNLALQSMATGGIYLGGGISPKIAWKLRDGTFMKSFADMGRLTPFVRAIPVRVIMNDRAALLGAAAHAADSLRIHA